MFLSIGSLRVNGRRSALRARGSVLRTRFRLEPLEDRRLLSAYTPGPLVLLSSPDPLPAAPPGFAGANVAAEPYVAVNPTNPDNIVAVWMDHPFVADVASVT